MGSYTSGLTYIAKLVTYHYLSLYQSAPQHALARTFPQFSISVAFLYAERGLAEN